VGEAAESRAAQAWLDAGSGVITDEEFQKGKVQLLG